LLLAAAVTFTRKTLPTRNGPRDVVVRDFNRDGQNDIVVANSRDQLGLTVYRGLGRGSFKRAGDLNLNAAPFAMLAGDFNNDGLPDLAIADGGSSNIIVALNTGGLRFNKQTSYFVNGLPVDVVAADFDRNGVLDLAAVTDGGTLALLLGNGNGTFVTGNTFDVGVGPRNITVGDFNGDLFPDVAVTLGSNEVAVMLNNRGNNFLDPKIFFVGQLPTGIVAGQFTGTPAVDLAVANQADNTVSVLRGDGRGNFVQTQVVTLIPGGLPGPTMIDAADLNADGFQDLVVTGTTFNQITIAYGNASGRFITRQNVVVGNTPVGLAIADLDKNGSLDIVVTNFNDNTMSLLFQSAAPGDTFATAIDLGTINGTKTVNSSLGPVATQRFYKFTLAQASAVRIMLFNLTAHAALTLFLPGGRQITSNRPGTVPQGILGTAVAGTYHLRITVAANTRAAFRLSVSATPAPGETTELNTLSNVDDTPSTAINLGTLSPGDTVRTTEFVGKTVDVRDNFKFSLTAPGMTTVTLGNLTGDAALVLYQKIATGYALLVRSDNPGTRTEVITRQLFAGTYLVVVVGKSNTTYRLTVAIA
jgi:hypothetical protein